MIFTRNIALRQYQTFPVHKQKVGFVVYAKNMMMITVAVVQPKAVVRVVAERDCAAVGHHVAGDMVERWWPGRWRNRRWRRPGKRRTWPVLEISVVDKYGGHNMSASGPPWLLHHLWTSTSFTHPPNTFPSQTPSVPSRPACPYDLLSPPQPFLILPSTILLFLI